MHSCHMHLLFIVLDQMDPKIDGQISEHVLRMHRYRSTSDGGDGSLDRNSQYGREEDVDADAGSYFVKYNRMLHGKKAAKEQKQETLTINFLKKYIHYAKNRFEPELSDEASEHIATAYAELRNASTNAKGGGGTLPITARTLETIIRLSTAHAKLKLNKTILKSDVEAALKVLNFAIYHKELTEMEQREQERELERKRKADQDDGSNSRGAHCQRAANLASHTDGSTVEGDTIDAMDVDDDSAAQPNSNLTRERAEAFNSIFGQHMRENHLDLISVSDVEIVVNSELLCLSHK
ncbi:DNA replication licensing factor MCM3 homolog 1-like protein [Drosera capensis]